MTADADLVVRGHLIGVTVESIQSFAQNPLHESLTAPFGVVAIEEVLKGRPESKVPGEILVARLGIPGMEAAALPQEPLILFLKNYAQMRVDLGVEPASDADDRYHYAQPNGYQCVLRDFGNLVALLPGPDGWEESSLGPFPSDLAGKPFDDIVATVAQEVDAVSSAE